MSEATVYITNTGDESFTDGWDGVRYEFKPGKTVEVPEIVARHVFAHGLEDKRPALARLGWAETSQKVPEGLARLAKFKVEDAPAKAAVPDTHGKLWATNRSKTTFSGAWDGVKYDFRPSGTVMLTDEAAAAILGHGKDNKEAAVDLLRHVNPSIKDPKGLIALVEISKEPPKQAAAA